ncbi:PREDICTED: serine--pyruvate aminotransferase, mitochondrial [Nicrophorus vespilloides]|uniref:Alanine--glyoxylate aminotransferase n=1 Tax=Nicrophorus vespilloides TaxID=110193 RepID=A0ABM1MAR3_NICVS|nr:PREDICTED: serine--pyruvate aminotransferase, mitochondrial [Nicrophorus vespilloides]XP_017771664.1 PREDICTED: serine--pyruvate aminotransferase, mitochondrial [Nicrophorus vespilloides]
MRVEKPEALRKPLIIPHKTLMGAGPSNCTPRILHALSQPVLGHLHTETTKIMDEVKAGIQYIFQTRNELTLAVSASGHGGMETVMCNLLEPGEKVLVATNGIWGERASNMAERYGSVPVKVTTEPGNNFSLAQLEMALMKHKPVMLFIVQGESSTGVYQPLEGLGDLCHRFNCLLAVDTVASLGGVPVLADEWGIDAIYTGTQKVLGAPPGITPISFSDRAKQKIFNRKTEIQVFYWDMKILGDYWACFGNPRVYHHTISTTLLYGLREALAMVAEEGIQSVIERHENCARLLREGLEKLGLQLYVSDASKRLPTITTVKVPHGVQWKDVTNYAMNRFLVEIAGGLGPTANKVFRIGLMGYNASPEKVEYVLRVMQESVEMAKKMKPSKL